ncbi:hypothetical protein DFH06DRAFT_1065094 [Mycena polygramma]|nr:hypothetical protein DFH06DRAFT_1065094 [Mycena polygramma]
MSSSKNILLFGATGYIGGSVLQKLLAHPRAGEFKISVFVRDASKAEKLRTFGVTAIVGDLASDFNLLTALAKDADVVFTLADSTNKPAEKAILAGAKARFEATKKPTTYIHVSGVGAIADCTVYGRHPNSPTYDDSDAAQMATIAPTQLHRPVDLEILAADDTGYIKSYIVLPTTVYGLAKGPLVEAGIQKEQTGLMPLIIGASLARGQGGSVGEGKNIWYNVEVYDLADLFIMVFNAAVGDATLGHGRLGLYFAENGFHELCEVYEIVARIQFEYGKGQSAIPTPFDEEEMKKYFGGIGSLIGSNAKCSASRARALGWRPVNNRADFLAFAQDVTTSYVSRTKETAA